MDLSAKRDTILLNRLWLDSGDVNAKVSESNIRDVDVNKDTQGKVKPPKKLFEKTYIYRMGVPVKLSEKDISLASSKKSLLDKYHKSYNID